MTATTVAGNMFSEGTLLITIQNRSGTLRNMQFVGMTESVDITGGEKDIEQIPTVRGGRLIANTPQAMYTISFSGYPVDTGDPAGDLSAMEGVDQIFFDSAANWETEGGGGGFTAANTRNRERFRVSLLWTTDTAATSAIAATAASTSSYRLMFNDCYMTSVNPSFGTDNRLKVTFVFKCAPFNAAGHNLVRSDAAENTALTAPPAYNSTGTTYV